ncbi:MAG: glycosyltransferase family 2 protein [Lachnospiraceae bacterium]|nr:glycosyltransferase family 2 protein [Lachnospiraceae bacterium]
MKTISFMIPTFNEVDNAEPISRAIIEEVQRSLPEYDYEIVFIDNCSTDGTRDVIRKLCSENPKIKAILNVTNFGQFNSPFYGICQTTGDCTISIAADFQEPVSLIPTLVHEWEKGHKIVSGIKTSSREPGFIYFLRTCYYKIIRNMSSVKMIEHFSGYGLYDRTFVQLLRELDDPIPFLRGIVAEYGEGFNMTEVEFTQEKRRAGKSSNNFYSLYDAAMLSFTSYTKVGLRLATLIGFIAGLISFIVAIVYLVLKICYWDTFSAGYAPMTIGVFLLGSLQLFFIGFLGEYVLNINSRVIHRPVVVEEERINF